MSDLQLNELGVPGKVWMTIKADDTEFNRAVFSAFKELAAVEHDHDWTQALNMLLRYYESDAKIELLWAAMNAMERRIEELEQFNAKKTETKERGMF